ncbi:MAG: peptidyl-prolyl cis-trans isomerase, partial [bacterium]
WALASLTFIVAGCVPTGEEAVATIDGEHEVTASDLEYYYERGLAAGQWSAEGEVGRTLRDILEAAIDGKVLEIEAEERGYADDALVQEGLTALKSQALRDYMWRRIEDAVVVTEADVFGFYEKGRNRRMYSFIEVDDVARAEEAHYALEAGPSWEKAVEEFSTFQHYTGEGGAWDVPMEYAGDEASEALFALAVGEYTPPIEDAEGLVWRIYRCDKVVHGSGLSFDEARADIEMLIKDRKTRENFAELVRGWRKAAPIERNDELWREISEAPFADLKAEYAGEGVLLSDVGGVPVYFDDGLTLIEKYLLLPPEEMDRMREAEPFRYEAVWNVFLSQLEDRALLEYQGLKEGMDNLPSFRREMAARRGDMLIDILYREQFLSRVPEPTPEEVEAFYERHRDDFYVPERVEVYLVAIPDRVEVEGFYGEVKAGADLVVTGEARNRAREKAAQELYELPPSRPPREQERLGVVAVTADPMLPNAPPDPPLAAELRPRVFPFEGLNVLSDVFQLGDGRWAFYEPIYRQPSLRRGLDDPEVAYFCRKGVFETVVTSPETSAAAEEWIRSLRARHDVDVDEAALARVVAELRRRVRP